jgi:hypothetical protein
VAYWLLLTGRRMPPVDYPAAVGGYASRCTQTDQRDDLESDCQLLSAGKPSSFAWHRGCWLVTTVVDVTDPDSDVNPAGRRVVVVASDRRIIARSSIRRRPSDE